MTALLTGVRSAALGALCLLVVGAIGIWLKQPWVFPSLGPTLMVIAETPREPAARPQNVLLGHVVGIGCGLASLLAFGLRSHPSAVQEGLTWPRVACACLALAATALLLQLLRVPHPPAGASTLLVALGVLRTDEQLQAMLLAIVLISAVAVLPQVALRRSPDDTR